MKTTCFFTGLGVFMEIRWRTSAGTVGLRQMVYQSGLGGLLARRLFNLNI
jgi:hypothetical protein